MTPEQVSALLAYRAQAWGRPTTAGEAAVWVDALGGDPPEGAVEAMRELARTKAGYPPTIAEFREMRRAMTRANTPALGAGPPARACDADTWRAGMAMARAALRKEPK